MSARFYRNPMGRGFAGGLPCQAPSEGDQPFTSSPFAHPIPLSRRRASGDLFSGSLALYHFYVPNDVDKSRARKSGSVMFPDL